MNTRLYNRMWGPSEFHHSGLLGELDFFPRLHEIQAPTLLICGQYDTATRATMREARMAIGAHAEVAIIEDAGHKSYVDNREEYLRALNEFTA